ncbi:MAG: hypothetical protein ACOWWR_06195 [Eubacteriales bacterium]
MSSQCEFCGAEVSIDTPFSNGGMPHYIVDCPQCGMYDFYYDSVHLSSYQKVVISGVLFETHRNRGELPIALDKQKIDEMLISPLVPKSLSERISKFVTYIDSESRYFGQSVTPPIPVMYVADKEERKNFLRSLMDEHLINLSGNVEDKPEVSLTLKALDFIKPRIETSRPGQCFVAMWFDSSMDRFFDRIVKPACAEAGYEAIRVSDKEFTGEITDEIIAGIKESAFVIADFTGHRGGVYYEAGYAIGLGKTVIQMCAEKDQDQLHFDINHRNTIFWDDTDIAKFRKILTNRIRATIGLGSKVNPT